MQIRSRRIQGHLQTLFLNSSRLSYPKSTRMDIFSKKYSINVIVNFKIIRPSQTYAANKAIDVLKK